MLGDPGVLGEAVDCVSFAGGTVGGDACAVLKYAEIGLLVLAWVGGTAFGFA